MRALLWGHDSGLTRWVFVGKRQVRRDGKVTTRTDQEGTFWDTGFKYGGRVRSHRMWEATRASRSFLDGSEETSLAAPEVLLYIHPKRFPPWGEQDLVLMDIRSVHLNIILPGSSSYTGVGLNVSLVLLRIETT